MGRAEEGHRGICCKMSNLQRSESRTTKVGLLIQVIQVPTWKREHINMYFVVGLPRIQKKYESIWVVVYRLTKSANFIPIKSTYLVGYNVEIL